MRLDLVGKMVHVRAMKHLYRRPDEVLGADLLSDGTVAIVIADGSDDYAVVRMILPDEDVKVYLCQGMICVLCGPEDAIDAEAAR